MHHFFIFDLPDKIVLHSIESNMMFLIWWKAKKEGRKERQRKETDRNNLEWMISNAGRFYQIWQETSVDSSRQRERKSSINSISRMISMPTSSMMNDRPDRQRRRQGFSTRCGHWHARRHSAAARPIRDSGDDHPRQSSALARTVTTLIFSSARTGWIVIFNVRIYIITVFISTTIDILFFLFVLFAVF